MMVIHMIMVICDYHGDYDDKQDYDDHKDEDGDDNDFDCHRQMVHTTMKQIYWSW